MVSGTGLGLSGLSMSNMMGRVHTFEESAHTRVSHHAHDYIHTRLRCEWVCWMVARPVMVWTCVR